MANILVNVERGIEIAATDALKWLGKAQTALSAAPGVVAGLATLAAAVDKPLTELTTVVANPLNIPLDIQTANDLKAVWPDLKAFLGTLGVKFWHAPEVGKRRGRSLTGAALPNQARHVGLDAPPTRQKCTNVAQMGGITRSILRLTVS